MQENNGAVSSKELRNFASRIMLSSQTTGTYEGIKKDIFGYANTQSLSLLTVQGDSGNI